MKFGKKRKTNYDISHIDRTHQDPGVYKQIQNPLFYIKVCGAQVWIPVSVGRIVLVPIVGVRTTHVTKA